MDKFRLLVIDDQIDSRKAFYERVFYDFKKSMSPTNIDMIYDNIDGKNYEAIILDMVLDLDPDSHSSEWYFEKVVSRIRESAKNKPLILVTAQFDECSHLLNHIYDHQLSLLTIISVNQYENYLDLDYREDRKDFYLKKLNDYLNTQLFLLRS